MFRTSFISSLTINSGISIYNSRSVRLEYLYIYIIWEIQRATYRSDLLYLKFQSYNTFPINHMFYMVLNLYSIALFLCDRKI